MFKPALSVLVSGLALTVCFSCSTSRQTAPEAKKQPAARSVAIENAARPKPPKPPYRPSATRVHDLLNTRLEVQFDWQKQHLLGVAQLTLKPYFYAQQELVLDAKGFDIHSVALVKPGNKALKYTYDQRQLRIQLDRSYTRHEQFTIEIDYTAKPNELNTGGKDDAAAIKDDKGLYFINPLGTEPGKPKQIWTQGETHGSSAWFPTIDHPNERMTQDIYIKVDKQYTTLSNGTLMYSRENADGTRTDYWKQDKSHAPYLTMMAIGQFAVLKDKWRNLEVNYYVEPEYRSTAKKVFGNTPEMMEFFSKKLGVDFPWDKYAQVVVRDYVSGAMENTSASVFMEALQLDSREVLDKDWDGIIAHELFHQWFGDLVTCESWANLALNESFADYSELLWAEHKYGPDAAAAQQKEGLDAYLAEATFKQVPIIRYHHRHPDDMFDSHSYSKGGRVLHMLRTYVGDEAFFASLQLYLTRHKFSVAEIEHLRQAFEEVTGEDLKWFFDQWFLTPGHPVLRVKHSYAPGKLTIEVRQTQDTTKATTFKLPVKLAWWEGGKKHTEQVFLAKSLHTFEFQVATQPDLVTFDDQHHLLAEITHPKTKEEHLYQLQHAGHYLPQYQASRKLIKEVADPAVRKAFLELFSHPFHELREQAAEAFNNYKGADQEKVAAALRNMAEKDPRRPSRAIAIEMLASLPSGNYSDLFLAGLQDSSYAVVAASATALATTKPAEALAQIEALEKVKKAQIVTAVASYYAEANVPGKQPWFQQQLSFLKSGTLYLFLQDYGKYLLKQNQQVQSQATPALVEIARSHPQFYVRIGAVQALNLLNETEALKQTMKGLRENEKDTRVQQVYQMP